MTPTTKSLIFHIHQGLTETQKSLRTGFLNYCFCVLNEYLAATKDCLYFIGEATVWRVPKIK